jgi:hypothetical protein
MAAVEKSLSMLNVATTALFACGCLSFTPLIPYISRHRWMFFLVASIALVFVNALDLYTVVNACSNSEIDDKDRHFEPTRSLRRRYARLDSANIFNADVISAALFLLGSIMLLNSSVLAIMNDSDFAVARWQFVGAFAIHTVGYACNTLRFHDDALEVIETRNAVVFQMSMSTTLNLIGALANAPGIGCAENDELRATLRSWLHGLAGLIALGGALVNHFHSQAFMTNEEILFAERRYNAVKAKQSEEEAVRSHRSTIQKIWSLLSNGIAFVVRRADHNPHKAVGDEPDVDEGAIDVYMAMSGSEVSDIYQEDTDDEDQWSFGNYEPHEGGASELPYRTDVESEGEGGNSLEEKDVSFVEADRQLDEGERISESVVDDDTEVVTSRSHGQSLGRLSRRVFYSENEGTADDESNSHRRFRRRRRGRRSRSNRQ